MNEYPKTHRKSFSTPNSFHETSTNNKDLKIRFNLEMNLHKKMGQIVAKCRALVPISETRTEIDPYVDTINKFYLSFTLEQTKEDLKDN